MSMEVKRLNIGLIRAALAALRQELYDEGLDSYAVEIEALEVQFNETADEIESAIDDEEFG